tara:strand:+ start:2731 stop:3372 length:642 start_codon:yes stop_codon:yes gene_type:complete
MKRFPIKQIHLLAKYDEVYLGQTNNVYIVENIIKNRNIACISKNNKKLTRFTLRKNNHYVQFGYTKDTTDRTLYMLSEMCSVCGEYCDNFLLCNKIVKHFICNNCLIKTAALNKKNCPVCRISFQIPKRLLYHYTKILEQENERLERELKELDEVNDQTRDLINQTMIRQRSGMRRMVIQYSQNRNEREFFKLFMFKGFAIIALSIAITCYLN